MQRFWIIGVGQFGLIAVKRLSAKFPGAAFVCVDPDKANLAKAKGPNRTLAQIDGVAFVNQHLQPQAAPDWIIPALPVHLAAEWCLEQLAANGLNRIDLPENLAAMVPHPLKGEDKDLYVSHADFTCPDNCDEPNEVCTITGEPRQRNMFEVLQQVKMPEYTSLVIRSHQLAPGIGGYRPQQLFNLRQQVTNISGNMLLSTACRCHGVMTALTSSRQKQSANNGVG